MCFVMTALNIRQSMRLPVVVQTETTAKGLTSKIFPEPTFIDLRNLLSSDIYSAAWWMSRHRFNQVALAVSSLEAATFEAISKAGKGHLDVRMTVDFLDYSVEHVSNWYKMIGTDSGLAFAARTYLNYVSKHRAGNSFTQIDSFMNTTIAVVPFGVPDGTSEAMQDVMVSVLSATVTALLQHAVKRVVVVGYFNLDSTLVVRVFNLLSNRRLSFDEKSLPFQDFYVGSSEVAFVHTTNVKSHHLATNVPHGALKGLQEELRFGEDNSLQTTPHPNNDTIGSFLGRNFQATDFEYVYFTEPDQMLHARLASSFWKEMDDNRIIIPHRLQPIPHPDDLINVTIPEYWHLKSMPSNHSAPISLDRSIDDDACCDFPDDYGKQTCNNFWWICDFEIVNGNFSYFEAFEFIKLTTQGTGIVTLAGNCHGRICRVKRHGRGTCTPLSSSNQNVSTTMVE